MNQMPKMMKNNTKLPIAEGLREALDIKEPDLRIILTPQGSKVMQVSCKFQNRARILVIYLFEDQINLSVTGRVDRNFRYEDPKEFDSLIRVSRKYLISWFRMYNQTPEHDRHNYCRDPRRYWASNESEPTNEVVSQRKVLNESSV